MALDPREFIRLHAGMPEHPKVDPLSDSAFRALIEAWCLCRRTRNDGRIPLAAWTKKWKLKARKELIAAGLVHLEDGAAVVHDWLEHQPSVAEMDKKRAARVEAGRKGGQTRRATSKPGSTGEANASAKPNQEHEQQPKQNGSETEPELEVEKDISTYVEMSPHVGQRAGKTRGNSDIAARLNATARSAAANSLAETWAKTCEKRPPKSSIIAVAKAVDECLRGGYDEHQIAAGVRAWEASSLTLAAKIPEFVHQVVNRAPAVRAAAAGPQLTAREQEHLKAELMKDNPNPELLRRAGIDPATRMRALPGDAL